MNDTVDRAKRAADPVGSDWKETLGRAGYAARSAIWMVVGILFIQSGITYDADKAGGLSAALKEMADTSWGPFLLGAVAIGLFAFGAFCLVESRYRRDA